MRAADDATALARAALRRARPVGLASLTLEQLLTAPDMAAFAPSPAQLALVRASDGTAITLAPDRALFHFGATLPTAPPRILVVRTGVRAGKSLLATLGLLRSILAADLSCVRPGEHVRAVIVVPRLRTGSAPFKHLVGTMRASRRLSSLLVTEGAESCVIRRPDGHHVAVQIAASSAGGINLRSTWLAGALFDEADFHHGEDGAVNLPDNLRATIPRILPNGQVWIVSSPWADTGPFHKLFTDAFGRPGDTVAFHSDSRSMYPGLSLEDERAERERDPDNAAREYDAIPLTVLSSAFFPRDAIDASIAIERDWRLPPKPGVKHYAGTDLGFRRNSSALAVARTEGARVVLAYHEELRPEPQRSLKPSEVCASFAITCKGYGATSVQGDLHYADTAREEMGKLGVWYEDVSTTSDELAATFTEFRRLLVERRLELPNDPRLINMIRETTTRPTPAGKIQVRLPTEGRSHGDVLMAVVLACVQAGAGGPAPIRAPAKPKDPYRYGGERGFG